MTIVLEQAYIFDAIRTPRGKGRDNGALHEVKPINLLATVLAELNRRNPFNTQDVDDIVIGCVTPLGEQGANIGKVAALVAGYDQDNAGVTLNRFCASGLEAVNLAAMKIRSGWEQLVIAGGVESMSRVKMGADGGAWAFDAETRHKTNYIPQGVSADLIATIGGFNRLALDEFAMLSHQKAAKAHVQGWFNGSIIPIYDNDNQLLLNFDEMVRSDCDTATLGALKPAFVGLGSTAFDGDKLSFDEKVKLRYPGVDKVNHDHSAGNSSAIVDGAAAILIGSKAIGMQYGFKPRAKIIATALVGSEPSIMLTGPAPAAKKALKLAGLSVSDIDLFEVNEAFASVVLRFIDELKLSCDKVNVNGGAIAMGHPLGATGAMLVNIIVDELERRNGRYGLVTLCAGAGIGIATIIERVADFD